MFSNINIKRISGIIMGFSMLAFPVIINAQTPESVLPSRQTVPNSTAPVHNDTGITYDCQNENGGKVQPGECNFQDLVKATQKIVNWGTTFALMFSVVVLAYAGFKYMISGDKPKERSEANTMLVKVVKGIAFILAAWLIVNLILNALGVNNVVKLG